MRILRRACENVSEHKHISVVNLFSVFGGLGIVVFDMCLTDSTVTSESCVTCVAESYLVNFRLKVSLFTHFPTCLIVSQFVLCAF